MKTTVVHLALILASLIAVISPVSVNAQSATDDKSVHESTNIIHKHKSPGTTKEIFTATDNTNIKHVLIEESREMSPFFKLGIAINIVMILTFGWWFSKEWRRRK